MIVATNILELTQKKGGNKKVGMTINLLNYYKTWPYTVIHYDQVDIILHVQINASYLVNI